ncbi:PRD domain-containing protein [Curtobacterium sp. NPDC089689]|uniref:PRD domain-containing protein n=1 Tax=Curtobacterium sp. NPDC089689 TaxID=3363968 RepID=UPI0037F20827
MKILHVFNNNAVLADDGSGREVVLTGRGVGFKMRAGQHADTSRVARTFVPDTADAASQLGDQIAAIPMEYLHLADATLGAARRLLPRLQVTSGLVVAVADHVHFAVLRMRDGLHVRYPLGGELAYLYPAEWDAARLILDSINNAIPTPLPSAEITPITLHLVSATHASVSMADAITEGDLLIQAFNVVEQHLARPLDRKSVAAARFFTHLRYIFVRARSERQSTLPHSALAAALQLEHRIAWDTALRLRELFALRLGHPLSSAETVYLALHVARIADEAMDVDAAASGTGEDDDPILSTR